MFFDLSKVTTHQTYNLLIGLVAQRPIAWITSLDLAGKINAAPFCGAIVEDEPLVIEKDVVKSRLLASPFFKPVQAVT
jgi:hypothetical protein